MLLWRHIQDFFWFRGNVSMFAEQPPVKPSFSHCSHNLCIFNCFGRSLVTIFSLKTQNIHMRNDLKIHQARFCGFLTEVTESRLLVAAQRFKLSPTILVRVCGGGGGRTFTNPVLQSWHGLSQRNTTHIFMP